MVWRHNVPQEKPTANGNCRLLHQRPWVAYTCPLRMWTGTRSCDLPLVAALRWDKGLAEYVATVKRVGISDC